MGKDVSEMKSIFRPGAASTPPPGETSLINHYILSRGSGHSLGTLCVFGQPTSQSESANKLCARCLPWADYD